MSIIVKCEIQITMKLKFLLLTLFTVFCFSAYSQTAEEVQETIARMQKASTPCNGAPEAFKDFVAKFSTDREFFDSRLNLPEEEMTKYADILVPENMDAKTPFEKDDDFYYQAWGELQYNKAYLDCGWVDSYVTHTYEFTRGKGGKWYLTHIVPGE